MQSNIQDVLKGRINEEALIITNLYVKIRKTNEKKRVSKFEISNFI